MFSIARCLGLAALLASQAQALYFYIDGQTQKCFYEELPKDTLVVGHYKVSVWNEQARTYLSHPDAPSPNQYTMITVEETFDNNHRIVNQRGSSSGKFTFSAADSGDHRICFLPMNIPAGSSGFLFSGNTVGNVRFEVDMAIGETSQIESADKDKMGEVVQKVKDINARLQDIKREQVFQREREAEFRDQSESVNARVVRWSLIQLFVLIGTCVWQLSYLRAFFIKQKLT